MKRIALIALSLMLVSPAFAKRGEGKKGDMQKIFKQLDLSKEQKKELKDVRKSRKDKMKALGKKKKEARKAFKKAMHSNDSDSSLKSLHTKMLDAHTTFKEYKFETMLKTRALLNGSQRKKFSELKGKMRGKRGRD